MPTVYRPCVPALKCTLEDIHGIVATPVTHPYELKKSHPAYSLLGPSDNILPKSFNLQHVSRLP